MECGGLIVLLPVQDCLNGVSVLGWYGWSPVICGCDDSLWRDVLHCEQLLAISVHGADVSIRDHGVFILQHA